MQCCDFQQSGTTLQISTFILQLQYIEKLSRPTTEVIVQLMIVYIIADNAIKYHCTTADTYSQLKVVRFSCSIPTNFQKKRFIFSKWCVWIDSRVKYFLNKTTTVNCLDVPHKFWQVIDIKKVYVPCKKKNHLTLSCATYLKEDLRRKSKYRKWILNDCRRKHYDVLIQSYFYLA